MLGKNKNPNIRIQDNLYKITFYSNQTRELTNKVFDDLAKTAINLTIDQTNDQNLNNPKSEYIGLLINLCYIDKLKQVALGEKTDYKTTTSTFENLMHLNSLINDWEVIDKLDSNQLGKISELVVLTGIYKLIYEHKLSKNSYAFLTDTLRDTGLDKNKRFDKSSTFVRKGYDIILNTGKKNGYPKHKIQVKSCKDKNIKKYEKSIKVISVHDLIDHDLINEHPTVTISKAFHGGDKTILEQVVVNLKQFLDNKRHLPRQKYYT